MKEYRVVKADIKGTTFPRDCKHLETLLNGYAEKGYEVTSTMSFPNTGGIIIFERDVQTLNKDNK